MKDNKCFARKPYGTCDILAENSRRGKDTCSDCAFFKTREQLRSSQAKVRKRLISLDEDTQRRIADKYFFGRLDWLVGGSV